MDSNGFDRLVKAFATTSARRQALRASVGGAFAATFAHLGPDAEAKKKRKKKKKKPLTPRCSPFTAACASAATCCGNEFGVVACRQQPAAKQNCATQFPGLRCCGLEGVICDPAQGNCGCCDSLVCSLAKDLKFRCAPLEA